MGKNVELIMVVITITSSIMQVMGSNEIIMNEFGIISSGIVKCIPNGEICMGQECCAGNLCKIPIGTMAVGYCQWCPTAGYPCGMLDPCCSGLTCDGYFSGTCH
ncbi:unnamed protein product [Amaranthus hypochondriacus]